jgi:nitroreductase
MNVSDAIRQRFSVRSYLDKPIEEEKLARVLEAARLAPSGGNRQAWAFVVVKDAAKRQALAQAAAGQAFVGQAPVVIVACGTDPGSTMMCEVPGYAVNVAIAIDHMTLQAVEEGLGTCWIGAFSQQAVRDVLGIPESVKVVELLPLGYPATQPPATKSRKPLSEIVMEDGWRA